MGRPRVGEWVILDVTELARNVRRSKRQEWALSDGVGRNPTQSGVTRTQSGAREAVRGVET